MFILRFSVLLVCTVRLKVAIQGGLGRDTVTQLIMMEKNEKNELVVVHVCDARNRYAFTARHLREQKVKREQEKGGELRGCMETHVSNTV